MMTAVPIFWQFFSLCLFSSLIMDFPIRFSSKFSIFVNLLFTIETIFFKGDVLSLRGAIVMNQREKEIFKFVSHIHYKSRIIEMLFHYLQSVWFNWFTTHLNRHRLNTGNMFDPLWWTHAKYRKAVYDPLK